MFIRFDNMNIPPSFVVNSLVVRFCCWYTDGTHGQTTASLDQAPGIYPPPYTQSLPDIRISPWERYIASSNNKCLASHVNTTGGKGFKPFFCNLYQYRHNLDLKFGMMKHLTLLLVSQVGFSCDQGWKAWKAEYLMKDIINMMLVTCLRVLKIKS